MATSTPPDSPRKLSLREVLTQAREANRELKEAIPKGHRHLSTVTDASQLAGDHRNLIGLTADLHSTDEVIRSTALTNMQGLFPESTHAHLYVDGTPDLRKARAFTAYRLREVTDEVKSVHKQHTRSWTRLTEKAGETETGTSAPRQPIGTQIGEAFSRHHRWLENEASTGARLGFAAAYIGAGSLLMYLGGDWLGQALGGARPVKLQVPDEEGHLATRVVIQPMSAAARILKGIVGTAGLGASFVGVGYGISHLSRGR